MPYGIANQTGIPDEDECTRLLHAAVAGGVTCFDTANHYGESEFVLGQYFLDKAKPVFMTKLKLSFDTNTKRESLERQIREAVETSLRRLQIPKIPVMMLHEPSVLWEHADTVAMSFRNLLRDGLIERAGVSFGNDIELHFFRTLQYVQDDLYEVVQIPLSILDHRLFRNKGLERLRAADKLVFVRSVFLQGLLFMSPDKLTGHHLPVADTLRLLRGLSQEEGMPLTQLAISFVRDLPQVDSLVIGVETAEQLTANLRLIAGPAISEKTRMRIMSSIGQLPESLLNPALWPQR